MADPARTALLRRLGRRYLSTPFWTKLRYRLDSKVHALVRGRGNEHREYRVALPDGYGAKQVIVQLSVPPMPGHLPFGFCDHAIDESGNPTRTVTATTTSGFVISDDLARSWRPVWVSGCQNHAFIHVRALGNGEFLAQVKPASLKGDRRVPTDVLVVNDGGRVIANHPRIGPRWHSCRAVDFARGTLMYAEYPANKDGNRSSSRVFRSRDRGRTWATVFEQDSQAVRHFHFLQARPGSPGEWWLTSGDDGHQSKIWISRDDGDNWHDMTSGSPLLIDGVKYPPNIFRLTDLVWNGDDVIWGADDSLLSLKPPGTRVFRAQDDSLSLPRVVGAMRWPVRSLVDVGDFIVVLSQGSNRRDSPPEESKPSVFLMPKRQIDGSAGLIPLFEIDNFGGNPWTGKGFTYSRASRVAFDGTFFTYRAPYQGLPSSQQILKWNISFE
jgi:hypothetical protein